MVFLSTHSLRDVKTGHMMAAYYSESDRQFYCYDPNDSTEFSTDSIEEVVKYFWRRSESEWSPQGVDLLEYFLRSIQIEPAVFSENAESWRMQEGKNGVKL